MGSVETWVLIETYSDIQENIEISDDLKKKIVYALTVNGDLSIDAYIIYCKSIYSSDGAKATRTPDPLHAMQVLYQLSYGPKL